MTYCLMIRTFYDEDLAKFVPSCPGRMKQEWRTHLYSVLMEVRPYCSVVWKNNYFLKRTPTGCCPWKAHGRYRVKDCVNAYVKADMSLRSDTHTRISVTVTGQCQHLKGKQEGANVTVIQNRVQLRGERRKAFAE